MIKESSEKNALVSQLTYSSTLRYLLLSSGFNFLLFVSLMIALIDEGNGGFNDLQWPK